MLLNDKQPRYLPNPYHQRDTVSWRTCALDTISWLSIYMKKVLDYDWLKAVLFKCNTSAKRVTSVQITHRNSGL